MGSKVKCQLAHFPLPPRPRKDFYQSQAFPHDHTFTLKYFLPARPPLLPPPLISQSFVGAGFLEQMPDPEVQRDFLNASSSGLWTLDSARDVVLQEEHDLGRS